jgi:hypothetical protein
MLSDGSHQNVALMLIATYFFRMISCLTSKTKIPAFSTEI